MRSPHRDPRPGDHPGRGLDLSCKRAASVVAYLVSQGVKRELLSAQCFGETQPVALNDTPEGQAKNRRVNITLTGDGT